MIERQKWVDHEFNLGIDIGWTKNIVCRAKDTAIRIEHHCKILSDEQLALKINDVWSIKEHLGHLSDLEELWRGRFLEFPKGNDELVMADMSNRKTNKSNHNNKTFSTLMNEFKIEREKTLTVFNQLDSNSQNHQAMHPRIKMLMRPIDLLFFVAEHDDHHIVSIAEIISTL